MVKELKQIIKNRVIELGLTTSSDEMVLKNRAKQSNFYIDTKSYKCNPFSEWNCYYYGEGYSIIFKIRFSKNGTYLDYVPCNLQGIDIDIYFIK